MSIGLANPVAEERLLACAINNPETLIAIQALGVTQIDFAYEQNQLIYQAINTCYEKGMKPDLAVVIDELNKGGILDLIGGDKLVKGKIECKHDPLLASEYATIVKECSVRRRINEECALIIEDIYHEPEVSTLIQRSEERIYSIGDTLNSLDSGHSISELVDRRSTRNIDDEFFPFRFDTLNDVNKGRKRGSLTIIAGYTSEGKSSISISETIHSCISGRDVALFSLEMTEDQVMNRIISALSGVSCKKLDEDTVSGTERAIVNSALETMKSWKLRVYTDPSVTPSEIRSLQMRNKHDHIIIDYLQRFDYKDYSEIPRMAKLFKNLALQTKCSVDLLSQITPAQVYPGKNPFPKPTLNNLYGGKATAHEADNVLFLWAQRHKDDTDGDWQRTGHGQVVVGKWRDGRADWSFDVEFDETTVSWKE